MSAYDKKLRLMAESGDPLSVEKWKRRKAAKNASAARSRCKVREGEIKGDLIAVRRAEARRKSKRRYDERVRFEASMDK